MCVTVLVVLSLSGSPLIGYSTKTQGARTTVEPLDLQNLATSTGLAVDVLGLLNYVNQVTRYFKGASSIYATVSKGANLQLVTLTTERPQRFLGQLVLEAVLPSQQAFSKDVNKAITNFLTTLGSEAEPDESTTDWLTELLGEMHEELDRYVSFVAAFNVTANQILATTLRKQEDIPVAEALYHEITKKGLPEEGMVETRQIGKEVVCVFFQSQNIAYVVYSVNRDVKGGLVKLKLNTWVKKNKDRFQPSSQTGQVTVGEGSSSNSSFPSPESKPLFEVVLTVGSV